MADAGVVIGISLGAAVLILLVLIFGCKMAQKNILHKAVKDSPTEHLLYAESKRQRSKRKSEEYDCRIHGHDEASPYSASRHIKASKKKVSIFPKMQRRMESDQYTESINTGMIPESQPHDKTRSGHVEAVYTNNQIKSPSTCPSNRIVKEDYEEFDMHMYRNDRDSRKDKSERSINSTNRKKIFDKVDHKLAGHSRQDISARNSYSDNRKELYNKLDRDFNRFSIKEFSEINIYSNNRKELFNAGDRELNEGSRKDNSIRNVYSHNRKELCNEVARERYLESRRNVSEETLETYNNNKIFKEVIKRQRHGHKGDFSDMKTSSKHSNNSCHPFQHRDANSTVCESNFASNKLDQYDYEEFFKMPTHQLIHCNSDVDEKTLEFFNSSSGTTVKEIVDSVKRERLGLSNTTQDTLVEKDREADSSTDTEHTQILSRNDSDSSTANRNQINDIANEHYQMENKLLLQTQTSKNQTENVTDYQQPPTRLVDCADNYKPMSNSAESRIITNSQDPLYTSHASQNLSTPSFIEKTSSRSAHTIQSSTTSQHHMQEASHESHQVVTTTPSSSQQLDTSELSNEPISMSPNSTIQNQINVTKQLIPIMPTSTTFSSGVLPTALPPHRNTLLSNNFNTKKRRNKSKSTRHTYEHQLMYTPVSFANEQLSPLHTSTNVSATLQTVALATSVLPTASDVTPSLPVSSVYALTTSTPGSSNTDTTARVAGTVTLTTDQERSPELSKITKSYIKRAVVITTLLDKSILNSKVSVNANNYQTLYSTKPSSTSQLSPPYSPKKSPKPQRPSSYSLNQSPSSNPPSSTPCSQNTNRMLDQLIPLPISNSPQLRQSQIQVEDQLTNPYVPSSMYATLISPRQYKKVQSPVQTSHLQDKEVKTETKLICQNTVTSKVTHCELNPNNATDSALSELQASPKKTRPELSAARIERNERTNTEDNLRSEPQSNNVPLRSNRSLMHSVVKNRQLYIPDSNTLTESDALGETLPVCENNDAMQSPVKKSLSLDSRVKDPEEPAKSSKCQPQQTSSLFSIHADLTTKIENVKCIIRNDPVISAILADLKAKRKSQN